MNDSAAWQTTSSPLDAATSDGIVRASSGSTMAWLGRRQRRLMPVLTLWSGMSSTATVVASEPVPEVVGMARCGFRTPAGLRPSPIGGGSGAHYTGGGGGVGGAD